MADESLDAVVVSRALNMAALALVKAYSAPWVLPLFSEHLEFAGGPVSADWFHQKVADALEEIPEIAGDLPAAEHCRKWVSQEWLMRSRSRDDGRLQYQLSESSLRSLRIVRDLVTPGTSVSEARLGSIADAVRRLADMTNPDISAQLARIDAQIEELQERRRQVEAGHVRRATTEEMTRQLGEVMGLMASLPADFRQLCAMVEKRHHEVTSAASSADSTKGAMVEEYLHEHDLLAQTSEGRAYRGFSEVLVSEQADTIRRDVDQVLAQDFARSQLGEKDRGALRSMMATLLTEEHAVQATYVKWTASLRRFLTRSSGGRHQRLLTLVDDALEAGRALCAERPGRVGMPDVLGIGPLEIRDVSQTQLWKADTSGPVAPIETAKPTGLPSEDREAMLVHAGTSTKAVTNTINSLIRGGAPVTAAQVFAATDERCQRLVVVLALIDLGIAHGHLDDGNTEQIPLTTPSGARRLIEMPLITFNEPIPDRPKNRSRA